MRKPHRFIRPVRFTVVPLRSKDAQFPNYVYHEQMAIFRAIRTGNYS